MGAILEQLQSGHRGFVKTVLGGAGGYWRLGLVLGYGNAVGVESGPESCPPL